MKLEGVDDCLLICLFPRPPWLTSTLLSDSGDSKGRGGSALALAFSLVYDGGRRELGGTRSGMIDKLGRPEALDMEDGTCAGDRGSSSRSIRTFVVVPEGVSMRSLLDEKGVTNGGPSSLCVSAESPSFLSLSRFLDNT